MVFGKGSRRRVSKHVPKPKYISPYLSPKKKTDASSYCETVVYHLCMQSVGDYKSKRDCHLLLEFVA